jgi:arylsulfatase A-like enzyme
MRSSLAALALALVACGSEPQKPVAPPPPPPPSAPPPVSSAELSPAPTATASAVASATPDAPKGPPGKMNVILLTVDSMRADMPWAGYARDIAPRLTAFEKTAVSYSRFYSISSYTAMSLGGLLAGRYPGELERSGYFFSNYPDSVVMFPELLQKAGVRTLSAHAHFYFDQKAGFRQGFDDYEMVKGLKEDNKTDENITSPQHLELAKKMLSDKANTASGKPFFAWFHFLDPHDVYMAHDGIGPYGKKPRDKYDAEITFVDKHLGMLLDMIDKEEWGKNTVVMISSDHGEAFGEHKLHRHGFEIYDILVHVPLMIRAPGAAPRHIDEPRSAIDLAPTILAATGAPAEPSFQGTNLLGEVYGDKPEARDVVIDLPRTSDNDRHRALIHGKYKLMSAGDDEAWELYDLAADPGEENKLNKSDKDTLEDMKARYKERLKTIKDICPKHTDKLKGKHKSRRC